MTFASFKYYNNQYEEAIYLLQNADSIFRTINLDIKSAGALVNIGIMYKNINKPQLALEYYKKAFHKYKSADDFYGMAKCHANMGIIYYNVFSDYQNALDHQIKALEFKEVLLADLKIEESDIALSLLKIGSIHWKLKQYLLALQYFKKALSINLQYEYLPILASNYAKMGVVYNSLQVYDSATIYHLKAIDIRAKLSNRKNLAFSYTGLYGVYRNLEEYDLALEYAFKSLNLRREITYHRGIFINLKNIGEIYSEMGNNNEALYYLKQAHEMSGVIDDMYLLASLHKGMATVYGLLKDYQKAYANSLLYAELTDSIFEKNNSEEIARMQTIYETNKNEKEILSLKAEKSENELVLQKSKAELTRQRILIVGVIVFLLVAGLIAFLLFNRYKFKQQSQQSDLELKNVKYESQLLRSQLNPHFIFNSLNSIQNFVLKNDKIQASSYLVKFANLMRNVLNLSRQEMVPLSEDIETLQINLELEKLRLKNKFDFKFILDKEIETEYIYIPPLLVQPHIENAVKHGISNLNGKGNITIEYELMDEFIIASVTDSGVGRNIHNKSNNHKSISGKLTNERLELLGRNKNIVFDQRIIDLYDGDGNPAGTRVEINLPFEHE